jgi:hypothetical protein
MNQFPQASKYTIMAISNFFEILRDISGSRCTTGVNETGGKWKIKQKNFNNFVGAPLGGRVNIYINFCLQVHSKVSAA